MCKLISILKIVRKTYGFRVLFKRVMNKSLKIYVHCQSGVRISIAVGILENKGFENVVNIREGYQDFPESLK
ncbi:rhodanese-like domain-containing protein [Staphylococcus shinii]|uniref:rhodanese-like domain-containing protein n=1 Tax=Staphylococcus shinii TaxID=2912228 RepID=UPI002E19E2A7